MPGNVGDRTRRQWLRYRLKITAIMGRLLKAKAANDLGMAILTDCKILGGQVRDCFALAVGGYHVHQHQVCRCLEDERGLGRVLWSLCACSGRRGLSNHRSAEGTKHREQPDWSCIPHGKSSTLLCPMF